MNDGDEFILALARQAYQEKPFYRWLYDNAAVDVERAGVQDIPFLTKSDIIRYEEETGQPYYLPVAYPDTQIEYRHTSGTTNRPITFPWLRAEWFFLCQSIFLNFISQIKGSPRFLFCVNPDEEERAKAFGSVLVGVSRDRLSDAPYVLDLIERERPNVIVDNSPGIWFNYLIEHGLEPRAAGIQMVLMLPNQELAHKIEAMGIQYGSVFGCTEGGLFGYSHAGIGEVYHLSDADPATMLNLAISSQLGRLGGLKLQMLTRLFPCECYQGLDLQRMIGRRDIRIQAENGRMEKTGFGELAITCANSVFPIVKHLNADMVEISPAAECACGFSGRSMRFHHRDHEVQVPYIGINGSTYNLQWIAQELKGFRRVFPVYYALNGGFPRIVVTFLEDDTPDVPRVDTGMAGHILAACCGKSEAEVRETHAFAKQRFFFPAIRVPPGAIPIRDGASLKSRLYLDTVSGRAPDEYQPLLALVERLIDPSPIIRAGSWFLPVEQPVEG